MFEITGDDDELEREALDQAETERLEAEAAARERAAHQGDDEQGRIVPWTRDEAL